MKKTLVIIVSAVLAILLVLAVLFVARGRSVGVTSSVDKRKILIGQAIHYSLVVRAPEGTETELPDMEAALKAFDIRDKRSSEEMSFGSRVIRKEYLLTLFNSGEFSIPSVTVKYRTGEGGAWKEIATRQIKINVKSLLPKDFKTEVPKVRIVGGELSDDSFGGAGIKAVGGRGREVEGLIRFPIKEDKSPVISSRSRNTLKGSECFWASC